MRLGLFVLATLVLAGCSTDQRADEPESFAMNGVVTVGQRFVEPVESLYCKTRGMTPNLTEGTPVVISDGAGVTVGSTALGQGARQPDGTCKFRFTPDVPNGVDFYAVKIGSADPVTIDAAAAQREVGLNFGT